MCGIFGVVYTDYVPYSEFRRSVSTLFTLSETRGKEASGVCLVDDTAIEIIKGNIRAKELIRQKAFLDGLKRVNSRTSEYHLAMGHARMVTNGSPEFDLNNQPIVHKDLIGIHNGIVANAEDIWQKHKNIDRKAEVDTEVLLGLINNYNHNGDLGEALFKSLDEVEGSVSVALIEKHSHKLLLFTNTGSLYFAQNQAGSRLVFASEKYILIEYFKESRTESGFDKQSIQKLQPDNGMIIDLKTCCMRPITRYDSMKDCVDINADKEVTCVVVKHLPKYSYKTKESVEIMAIDRLLHVDEKKIRCLRRCAKCLLPETFPGISFDLYGVCNICNQHQPLELLGEKKLIESIEKTAMTNQQRADYDCLIPISGGRDSCYSLHYAVKEMGLKPVAYTYDWGLVTDLARRNIQRMCAELKVEHILVSADIRKKRENVRKNVEAWLKKPNVGTVPLFMAGDKQFFYYAKMLKKQMRISSILFGMNPFEETGFKVGLTGIQEKREDGIFYDLSGLNKLKLMGYYGKEVFLNPAFINTSIFDSLGGFFSYYMIAKDYLQIYDYIGWEENIVNDTIINKYGWETADDTKNTWRIGDGTAAFYNYIYYRICGFSEFDTFRSNQIREGHITREEALENIYDENRPRVQGFLWFCNTIGINPIEAINAINNQATLYEK